MYHSYALMPRNAAPSNNVSASHGASERRPSWAARTPRAIVRLLVSSTTVFAVPSGRLSFLLPSTKASANWGSDRSTA